jgi:uncharacterized protein YndB with AHSA1/START domain
MKHSLKVVASVRANIQQVWDTLIHPGSWWEGTTLTPKIGGNFREVWYENGQKKISTGKVISLSSCSKLEVRWQDADWPDAMTFEFSLLAENSNKTNVTLTEKGWEMFPPDRRDKIMDSHRQGWNYHLGNLKQASESSKGVQNTRSSKSTKHP